MSWTTTAGSSGAHTLTARARDTSNNTANAASITVTVDDRPDTVAPTMPTGLAASALGPTQVALSWVASTDAFGVTGYQVFRNGAQIATTAGTSFTDTLLAPATVYRYAVAAYDAAGNVSPKTADVPVTTPVMSAGYQYPLKIGRNGRSLVDQQGRAFFINGDTGWSLIAQLTQAQADAYLASRQQLGFNAVLASLIEHRFASHAPANINGVPPFTTAGNFNTPNEAYFANADYTINKAAEKGMVVLLAPLYPRVQLRERGLVCRGPGQFRGDDAEAWGSLCREPLLQFSRISSGSFGGDVDESRTGSPARCANRGRHQGFDTVHLITPTTAPSSPAMDVWSSQPVARPERCRHVQTQRTLKSWLPPRNNRTPFKTFFLVESAIRERALL